MRHGWEAASILCIAAITLSCGGSGGNPQESNQTSPVVADGITISDLKYVSGPMQNGSDFYYFDATIYLKPTPAEMGRMVTIQLEHRESQNPNYPHPDWYMLTAYSGATPTPTFKYDNVKYARNVTVFIRQTAPATGPNTPGDNFPWMGVTGWVDGVKQYDKLWVVRTPF